jgi:polar amino acid transport system permease protein
MTRLMTLRQIVLPQAMRVIIPPTGNETISMLKTSSLASVATVSELLFAAELIYANNYETVPLLMVASIWYLIVTSILTVGQYYLERRFSRGSLRDMPLTPWQRLRHNLFTFHPDALPPEPRPEALRNVAGHGH